MDLRKIQAVKKGSSDLITTKMIVAILVLLVIIAVLFFLIKGDLLTWMKNLPSYSAPEDKTITIDPDTNAVVNDPVVVGIKSGLSNKGSDWFTSNEAYITAVYSDGTRENTFFYMKGTENNADIYYKAAGIWGIDTISKDKKVGTYSPKTKVVILPEFLDMNNEYVSSNINSKTNPFSVRALSRISGSFFKVNELIKSKNDPDAFIIGNVQKTKELGAEIFNKGIQDGRYTINLEPYVTINTGSSIKYLYLEKSGNVINIRGEKPYFNAKVGFISPSGIITLYLDNFGEYGLSQMGITYSSDGVSSLKVNYQMVLNTINQPLVTK